MADFYMSVSAGSDGSSGAAFNVTNSGSSSTAAAKYEFRINDTGTTRHDAIQALEVFKRWIIQGGLSGLGANLPVR